MALLRLPVTVVVPHVRGMLRPETHRAVLLQCPRAELVELDAHSPTDYARMLLALWKHPGDTIVVEQDVIPPEGAFASLLRCSSGWCTHPMLHGTNLAVDLLGLAKFGGQLKAFCPDAMEVALLRGKGSWNWPHWRSLDRLWSRWCAHRDYDPCVHQPEAVHLKYPRPSAQDRTPPDCHPAGFLSNRESLVGGVDPLHDPDDDRGHHQGGEGGDDDRQ